MSINFSGSRIRPTAQVKHAVLQRNIFLVFLGQDLTLRVLRWSTLKLKCQRLIPIEVNKLSGLYCYVLGVTLCLLLLPNTGLTLTSVKVRAGCVLRDSFVPIVFLNLDDAVTTMFLFVATLLPQGFSHLVAHPIHMRSVQNWAPSWSCGSENSAAYCESLR